MIMTALPVRCVQVDLHSIVLPSRILCANGYKAVGKIISVDTSQMETVVTYTAPRLYLVTFHLQEISRLRSFRARRPGIPFCLYMYLCQGQSLIISQSQACNVQQPARERCESRADRPVNNGLDGRRSRCDDSVSRRGARGGR